MDQPRVSAVEAVPGTQSVQVTWMDGTRDRVDLSEPIGRFAVLHPLSDPALFAKVKVVSWGWAIGWGDEEDPEIDYAADTLWRRARDQRPAAA